MADIVDIIKKIKKNTFSIINPLPTQKLFENLYSIKDGDSNYFIYNKDNISIAIDSGYKNSETRKDSFKEIGISENSISAIFLTHIDSDHAGCLYEKNSSFTNAIIYLNEREKLHITKEKERLKVCAIKVNHKLQIEIPVTYFNSDKVFNIENIKIEPILTPGHTLGHTCFLVDDKFLFVGDSLILKNGFGYRFFDLLGFNNKQNSKSLHKLKEFALQKQCKYIITSHTGITNDIEKAFKFCNKKLS
jgi:glyoxylase-like metal-dependent hydrolase (beta-lactamase superfamily II)